MALKSVTEEISFLKNAMTSFFYIFPLESFFRSILDKDFKLLTADEAYDVLIFLINACHEKPVFNTFLRQYGVQKQNRYAIMDKEILKKNIREAVKDLSTGKKNCILHLYKSDFTPPGKKFFKCCSHIARTAVDFQLALSEKKMGLEVQFGWLENLGLNAEEINILSYEEKKLLEEENKLYASTEETLKIQMRDLEDELRHFTNLKHEAQSHLHKVIDNCRFIKNKEDLKDETKRRGVLIAASKECDEIDAENERRLNSLKEFDEKLSFLLNSLENRPDRTIIDGKELAAHISYESRAFAEKENIKLFQNGCLSISGLLDLAGKSFRSCSENRVPLPQNLMKILEIKPPSYDPALLDTLESIEHKLNEELDEIREKVVKNVDKDEAERWLESFMTPIPALNFELSEEDVPFRRKDPIIDFKKIELLISRKNMESTEGTVSSSAAISYANQPDYRRFGFRRRSSSCAALNLLVATADSNVLSSLKTKCKPVKPPSPSTSYSEDSPVSTTTMESTKITMRRQFRRSSSVGNLLSTPVTAPATNGSPSTTEDGCKIKIGELFFEGDKSISPIYIGSNNVHSRLFDQLSQQPWRSEASSVSSISMFSPLHQTFSLISDTSMPEEILGNTFDSSTASISFPNLSGEL